MTDARGCLRRSTERAGQQTSPVSPQTGAQYGILSGLRNQASNTPRASWTQEAPGRQRAFSVRTGQFGIQEGIVESNLRRILSGVGERDALQPRPVDGGEAYGARFATGIDRATWQVEPSQRRAGRADSCHFRVGRRSQRGGNLIGAFDNDGVVPYDPPKGSPRLTRRLSADRAMARRICMGFTGRNPSTSSFLNCRIKF